VYIGGTWIHPDCLTKGRDGFANLTSRRCRVSKVEIIFTGPRRTARRYRRLVLIHLVKCNLQKWADNFVSNDAVALRVRGRF
jgi:hypothetical protein